MFEKIVLTEDKLSFNQSNYKPTKLSELLQRETLSVFDTETYADEKTLIVPHIVLITILDQKYLIPCFIEI